MCLLALLAERDAGLCSQVKAWVQGLKCPDQTKTQLHPSSSLLGVIPFGYHCTFLTQQIS